MAGLSRPIAPSSNGNFSLVHPLRVRNHVLRVK